MNKHTTETTTRNQIQGANSVKRTLPIPTTVTDLKTSINSKFPQFANLIATLPTFDTSHSGVLFYSSNVPFIKHDYLPGLANNYRTLGQIAYNYFTSFLVQNSNVSARLGDIATLLVLKRYGILLPEDLLLIFALLEDHKSRTFGAEYRQYGKITYYNSELCRRQCRRISKALPPSFTPERVSRIIRSLAKRKLFTAADRRNHVSQLDIDETVANLSHSNPSRTVHLPRRVLRHLVKEGRASSLLTALVAYSRQMPARLFRARLPITLITHTTGLSRGGAHKAIRHLTDCFILSPCHQANHHWLTWHYGYLYDFTLPRFDRPLKLKTPSEHRKTSPTGLLCKAIPCIPTAPRPTDHPSVSTPVSLTEKWRKLGNGILSVLYRAVAERSALLKADVDSQFSKYDLPYLEKEAEEWWREQKGGGEDEKMVQKPSQLTQEERKSLGLPNDPEEGEKTRRRANTAIRVDWRARQTELQAQAKALALGRTADGAVQSGIVAVRAENVFSKRSQQANVPKSRNADSALETKPQKTPAEIEARRALLLEQARMLMEAEKNKA